MTIIFFFILFFSFVTIYQSLFDLFSNILIIIFTIFFTGKISIKHKFIVFFSSVNILISIYHIINQNSGLFYFIIKILIFYLLYNILFIRENKRKIFTKNNFVKMLSFGHIILNIIVTSNTFLSPFVTSKITWLIVSIGIIITILGIILIQKFKKHHTISL